MDRHTNTALNSVVVAIDESDSSRAALAWAATYARDTGSELQAVHVRPYDFGAPLIWAPSLVAAAPPGYVDPEVELLHARLQTTFASITPEPGWTVTVLTGAPGEQLVHHARDARVLVLGTREHHGLERLVVGSVSHYCLNHARCPVVVVPTAVAPLAAADQDPQTVGGVPA